MKKPWVIQSVMLDIEAKELVIKLGCDRIRWCNTNRQLHLHGWMVRRWRHLDVWELKTVIEAEVPRVRNPARGKTEVVAVPWAERYARVTKGFERGPLRCCWPAGA